MTSSFAAPDVARWREFVAASPFGDVLQTLEWGPVKSPEYTPIPLFLERGGQLAATCLVLKKSLPAGRCYFYLSRGPILDWNNGELVREFFGQIRQVAARHRAIFIRTDPCVLDERGDVKNRLLEIGALPAPDSGSIFGGLQPRCNMILDLSAPIEDVFETKFESKWRYNTRLATKKNVTVTRGTREDLAIFHEIYRVTSARNGFTGYSLAYFQKMWDALSPSDTVAVFVARFEEKPLSAAIAFKLPPKAWYMFGASSNEERNRMPNHLMQWTMMQWAKHHSCTSYDFRGVPDPNLAEIPEHEIGLVKFKTGFGAQMTRYIGEYDLILRPLEYKLWTQTRPRVLAALRKVKK